MQSFNPDDKRYQCCCGNFNVERGAHIIAVIGIVFGVFGLISAIVQGQVINIVSALLCLLFYVSIIYAQRKQNPALYWPYLILNGFGIVMIAIYMITLVVLFIVVPEGWIDFLKPEDAHKEKTDTIILAIRIYTGVMIVLVSIYGGVSIWFQTVVYRAYEYMKMTHISLSTAQIKA